MREKEENANRHGARGVAERANEVGHFGEEVVD